jgi:hypothetical protein
VGLSIALESKRYAIGNGKDPPHFRAVVGGNRAKCETAPARSVTLHWNRLSVDGLDVIAECRVGRSEDADDPEGKADGA